jgi:predicted nucleic acid-binding protein
MRSIFVDTFFWIAYINPRDQWHLKAKEVRRALGTVRLITTEEVLIEVLNYFCSSGSTMRQTVARIVRQILKDPEVETIPQTHESFLAGLALYEARLDKEYSLTDCISMCVMREHSVTEVLTHDTHFAQEGFTLLL